MNDFTAELFQKLFTNKDNLKLFDDAVQELFRQSLEEAVNDILRYELDQFLDYERYQRSDNPDSRHGYYDRAFR